MQRWTFEDVATAETFTMVRNPRVMESPVRPYRTEGQRSADGVTRITRNPAPAFAWSFNGRCHSKAEQDDLRDWATRDRLIITDHHGRRHLVIPQLLTLQDVPAQKNGTRNPWLYEYTFKSLYLRRMP